MVGLLLGSAWAAPPKGLSDQECLGCHSNAGLTKEIDGKQVSLDVHQERLQASAHGPLGCTACHGDVKAFPHDPAPVMPACGSCHSEEAAAYDRGFHAKALKSGDKNAATCIDCHGGPHELLPASDPNSKVAHGNIPATCGACHGQKFAMERSGLSAQTFVAYQESVHGRSVAKNGGASKAAVCTDCHGTHEILAAVNPKSPIFKFNVPDTCGQCHKEVKQEFLGSIHGQSLGKGNWQAPVCTDCHGIHTIKAPTDPNSSVAAQALARTTCVRCHEGVRLTQEFGVPGNRVATYQASYHGLASQLGSTVVANCASCHGVHNILPSSDPRSTISPARLAETCGRCHPGAGANFIRGKVHVDAPLSADVGSVTVRWIRRFYLSLIAGLIGLMLLHNFLIWRRKAVERREAQRRIIVRMDGVQRAQHLTLLISFFTLVITGFALKYPFSWLAALTGGDAVRSTIHRIAAVVLIADGLFHLGYLITQQQGRRLFLGMMPAPQDATDIWGAIRYYLGFSPSRPQFARFSYAEKMEYWALVWGLFVMAGTGLMLWFQVEFSRFFPRWWLDIATAIHFYEAILATLAILVWHFYQVFLDPDVYPMNWAWYDGRMSVEVYQEEHALDAETVTQAVSAEAEKQAEKAQSTLHEGKQLADVGAPKDWGKQ